MDQGQKDRLTVAALERVADALQVANALRFIEAQSAITPAAPQMRALAEDVKRMMLVALKEQSERVTLRQSMQ